MTPTEILAEDLASLTDEEREIVLAEQQKARVKSVQERLAGLSEAQLEKLLSQATKPRRMKKTA
jgi:UDP-glucose 6-dehydrogenase